MKSFHGIGHAIFLILMGMPLGLRAQNTFTNGLVAYYQFSGNTADASENGRGLSNSAAVPAQDRFRNSDAAYYFNGISSIMVETNATDTLQLGDAFTLSCWVNISNIAPHEYSLVRKDGDACIL